MLRPETLPFFITDLRTRRLAGLKKEMFEELLKSAGISCRYFCRCWFTTCDVLLLSEERVKLAGINVSTKYIRLQLAYRGKRQIKITVCKVPLQLNGDVLAAYLSVYGSVEEVTLIRSADGTAREDDLNIFVNRESFHTS